MGISIHHGHCQALSHTATAPAFEAASITPCKPGTPEPPEEKMGMVQFTATGGRFNAKATSLKFLIEWSYRILPSQHSEVASWMDNERYDIVAKAEGNPSEDQMRLMMRTLMAERFGLTLRHETRKAPVVVISLGKAAPKLFPPKDGEQSSIHMEPVLGPGQKMSAWHVVATRFSFARLNETFSRHLERVIVNHTGMEGDFDFALDLTQDDHQPNPLEASVILGAMRDQLGLVVKSQDAPVDFFVIEHAERVAAGN